MMQYVEESPIGGGSTTSNSPRMKRITSSPKLKRINSSQSLERVESSPRIKRMDSFSFLATLGTQGPTYIVEQCANAHKKICTMENGSNYGSFHGGSLHGSNSFDLNTTNVNTIRFQIIIWSIGAVDVVMGRVAVKFRISLFWNNTSSESQQKSETNRNKGPISHYQMKGRQRAILRQETQDEQYIEVPPLSILNAVSFDIIGQPEIQLLNPETKLMRWTCLYRADLLQEDMRVDNFPHDEHDLTIKLGIITKREPGEQWDRRKWKLALATEEDSRKTIRVPHGVIVDHVEIPGFYYRKGGLEFDLAPLEFGSNLKKEEDQDVYLQVKIPVVRDSGYYDYNIIPLLFTLNAVSISLMALDASLYFQRTLLNLNCCFAEIGLRMSIDKNLPSVGYQIKIQSVQNRFLYSLLYLALESSILYLLTTYAELDLKLSRKIDLLAVALALIDMVMISVNYYMGLWTEGHFDIDTE